jgi:hypothetical protein
MAAGHRTIPRPQHFMAVNGTPAKTAFSMPVNGARSLRAFHGLQPAKI